MYHALLREVDDDGWTPLMYFLNALRNYGVPSIPSIAHSRNYGLDTLRSEIIKESTDLWNAKLSEVIKFFLSQDHDFRRATEKFERYRNLPVEEKMEVEVVEEKIEYPGTGLLGDTLILMEDLTLKPVSELKKDDQISKHHETGLVSVSVVEDLTLKPVSELKKDDQISKHHETGLVSVSVVEVRQGKTQRIANLEFANGKKLRMHPTYLLYVVDQGFCCVDPEQYDSTYTVDLKNVHELIVGDKVLISLPDLLDTKYGSVEQTTLTKISFEEGDFDTYHLLTASTSTHFANGFLVKNKTVSAFKKFTDLEDAKANETKKVEKEKEAEKENNNAQKILVPPEPSQYRGGTGKWTAAHFAVHTSVQVIDEVTDILLSKDIDLNALSVEGKSPLQFAIDQHYFDIATKLVNKGASVSDSQNGLSALHRLILESKNFVGIQKFEDLVKLLIPKTNINAQDPQTGSTVIHSAFKYASPQALNNLLYLDNFDPNLADKEGNTLLHAAFDYIKAKGGNSSYDWIINKLLEKKADPNVQNKAKFTPLWQAISLGSPTITKALLAAKADSSSVAYLCLAIQNKNEALARALIASGTPVNDLHEGIAPLHYAVRTKNKALVTLLLEAKADVNITSSGGCTPLHLAFATATSTIDSNFSLEKLLIDSGADINAIDEKGRTPLHYAFVKTLGAADNDSRSFDPITCVSGICEYKHLKIDVCDKWGRTPLHYAAIHASTISSLYLLKRGASLETKDKCGNTPLALAVYHKHTDYSIVLIQKDANLNEFNYTVQKTIQEEKDKAGFVLSRKKVLKETKQSIFRNVLSHQWQGVAHLMLDSKYDFFDAMQDAIDSGTLNFMANLLEKTTKENICRLNSQNQTLLHILSKSKGDLSNAPWEAIAQFLVNSGVSVTQTDIHGNNAIHYASRNFHWGLIQFLLKNNEDVNVKDKDGNTPIVLSLSFGNSRNLVATVKMLCNAPPADVTVEDTNGNTLFLLAIKTRTSLNNIHEIFQSFLGKNPAVKSLLNKRDKEDNTVLNLIIKRFISSASLKPPSDFVNLLKFLFQNGADVNAVDQSGSPLALVFLSYNTEPEGLLPLLQLFLEYKADMNIKFSYHTEESRSRDTGVVDTTKRLTRAELKALKEKPTGPSYSSSFLLYALRHNMKLLIAELLKPQYKIQIDAKDSDGSSALSYCIETKAWDLVDKLIAAGANPNQPNAEGITPLMTAVKTNDIALVRRLEKSEFALDLNTQDAKGKSIIHYVINPCEFGSYENVELLKLLAKLGANLELADNQNKKPLYYAMMQDDGKMANALVELGVKKMPAPPTRMSSVLGPDQWANAIDVDNDFEEYAKSLGDAVVKEDPPKPDRNLHLPHASVLSENGLIYDVLLTKTDVHYGEYGRITSMCCRWFMRE
eukprot:TRINITY_DN1347_c0_g3_i5.p1 TRINITY_DN1347_c0_g3~~TRINITY_DN1347_c0_g3_i5.p1  ORF type:complete len:1398 (-),score=361.28 TRINITY_DN1347_c0_g3_i5:1328-5521(-)